VAVDERLIKALHVETLRREDVHAEREPHVLFQASTIEALLDGARERSARRGPFFDTRKAGRGGAEVGEQVKPDEDRDRQRHAEHHDVGAAVVECRPRRDY